MAIDRLEKNHRAVTIRCIFVTPVILVDVFEASKGALSLITFQEAGLHFSLVTLAANNRPWLSPQVLDPRRIRVRAQIRARHQGTIGRFEVIEQHGPLFTSLVTGGDELQHPHIPDLLAQATAGQVPEQLVNAPHPAHRGAAGIRHP